MAGDDRSEAGATEPGTDTPLTSEARIGLSAFRVAALTAMAASHVGFMGLPGPIGQRLSWLLRSGWFGTDMFLCLAGFLCARTLSATNGRKEARLLGAYLARRAARALPAYYGFLLLYLIALPLALRAVGLADAVPAPLRSPGDALGAAAPYLAAVAANLFSVLSGRGPGAALEAMFALGVGAQVTVVVALLLGRVPERRIIMCLVCLLAIPWIARFWLWHAPEPWTLYGNPLTRGEGFVLGALLFHMLQGPQRRAIQRHAARGLVLAGMLFVPLLLFTDALNFHLASTKWLGYPAASLLSVSLLAWVLTRQRPWGALVKRLSRLAPWVYGMFLVKLPLMSSLHHALFAAGHGGAYQAFQFIVLSVLGTFVLGAAVYYVLERPLGRALGALPTYQRPADTHALAGVDSGAPGRPPNAA